MIGSGRQVTLYKLHKLRFGKFECILFLLEFASMRVLGMRITTQYSFVFGMAFALLAYGTQSISFANEPQDAHTMAQQFANAHKSKPAKTKSKNAIQPKEVEGAFKMRSQENGLKTTDQILDSIEARTKAIEVLLKESTSDKWNVYVGKPDSVVVEKEPTTNASNPMGTDPVGAGHAKSNAPTPTSVTDPTRTGADWAATKKNLPSTETSHARQNDEPSKLQAASPHVHPEGNRDITDLPEPGYALGGPANLRHGLAEASRILSTATILLKMKPGNKGLRRFKKTADPVLCGRRHCYRSNGFEKNAERMLRGTTLGPFNTVGRRAGACRQTLTCAFRHVDLMEDGVLLQPVDLKFLRHDRRAYRTMKTDPTCKISAGRLHCANPIKAKTWTAWIVPEHVALKAGSSALETALQDGLPETPIPSTYVVKSTGQ